MSWGGQDTPKQRKAGELLPVHMTDVEFRILFAL